MSATSRTRDWPGSATSLVAVFGHPVSHSLSPVMHNAALRAAAIDMVYVAIDVTPEHLATALDGLGPLGFVGINVTVPYKRSVATACTTLSPEATLVGAVNTVVVTPHGLDGHNTDTVGFLAGLPDDQPAGRAVVLGAGGAARAVAVALVRRGWLVTVVARRPDAATNLVDQLGAAFVDIGAEDPRGATRRTALTAEPAAGAALDAIGGLTGTGLHDLDTHLHHADLVVNATPLGLDGQSLPDPFMRLRGGQTAYDLVYNPAVTPFLAAAADRGARPVDGLSMLVGQAAAALQLWTGVAPDQVVMRQAAERALAVPG